MKKNVLYLLIFLFAGSSFSLAQEKIEREVKVKPSEVPISARSWLKDSFEKVKKPKWFLEFSQEGKAYEAKFWWEEHYHSVKFDSLGNLKDVEIEISAEEMPIESWANVQSYFKGEFVDYSVQKIQRQIIGSESDVEDFFDEGEKEGITLRYEIVFDGKKDNWQVWEALFDENGSFMTLIRVQTKPVDHLIF
ncbi:hypothetical protein DFQ04_0350 [Algoriphagus boseongensis]|uniref:PepSY-like beta-lactamase-inhibitor n=1 Tax=Algoriphagus boseongensis TaxID=1442587 RepID=A0A4R6T5Z5_9BACT|nr:hypothetical protein [Algoriphagus boseongensis]TDQ18548.1 hypothetical protein DFQ04_0350 [Algoriphagus boseongensis]